MSVQLIAGHHPDLGFVAPVNPHLAMVATKGLYYSPHDFGIGRSTLRTDAQQEEFIRLGKSKTRNSKHKVQSDGTVHAIDLNVYVGGRYSQRVSDYFDVAEAMQRAARELRISVIWGGCWRDLNTDRSVQELFEEYEMWCKDRHRRGLRRSDKPFIDGPHYELPTGYRP